MRPHHFIVVAGLFLGASVRGQVQSINIAGSYSGSFLLSGTQESYQIAGTPYLSESWMYGTLEMKREVIDVSSVRSRQKEAAYRKAILRCDELIQKITDPRFRTQGISLILDATDANGGNEPLHVDILHEDFEDFSDVTGDIESTLLGYLTRLRSRYESQLEELQTLDGLFRYNLYAQEFEMVYDRDTFAIIAPFNVKSISVSNMKFIHGFYVEKDLNKVYLGSSFFEVLNEGACKLLVRHAVKVKGGDAPVTYNWANAGGDAFVPYKQLYYQANDGSEILPFKRRRKVLRTLFADKYSAVMEYMKTEHLSLKNQRDLASLFLYYNSLDS
jgi:hypothetical protein